MRVLVTGSGGYIGRVAVPALQRVGHEVLGYDADWFGSTHDAPMTVIGDIRDALVRPDWPDVVVHLAGISNDPMGELDPAVTWGVNYWGTVEMLLHHRNAHHVVVSSCAVYGQATDLCTEESPVNPQSTYAACKAKVDEYLSRRDDIDYTVLRLGTVYGWSPNHRLDLVVNRMVFDALNHKRVTATGNAARPLTHIDDVAAAIVWAVEAQPKREVYNIVGENVRMHVLAEIVGSAAYVPTVLEPSGADTRDYMASGSKALRAGWSPIRTVAGTIGRLLDATGDYDLYNLDTRVRLNVLRRLIADKYLDPQTLRKVA